MNSETVQNDYSEQQMALKLACIDPDCCKQRVKYALDNNFPDAQNALSNLNKIKRLVDQGDLKPSRTVVNRLGGRPLYFFNDESIADIHRRVFNKAPLDSVKNNELSTKSLNTHLRLESALIELVGRLELDLGKPKGHENRDIVDDDGRIIPHALGEVLQDLGAPASCRKMITAAQKHKSD